MSIININLNLHKRLELSRPLTLAEGDDNWTKIEAIFLELESELNLALDGILTEIMPKGTSIIMSDGVILPSGLLSGTEFWYLCNGNTYNTIDTPNLLNRMIIGSGDDLDLGDTGGSDTVDDHDHTTPESGAHALTEPEMPIHDHVIENNGGAEADEGAGGTHSPVNGTDGVSGPAGGGQSHKHPSGGNTGMGGGHDNRSQYYSLAFIKYCRKDDE